MCLLFLSVFVSRLSFFRFFVMASKFICGVCFVSLLVSRLSFFRFFVMASVFFFMWRLFSHFFRFSSFLL